MLSGYIDSDLVKSRYSVIICLCVLQHKLFVFNFIHVLVSNQMSVKCVVFSGV